MVIRIRRLKNIRRGTELTFATIPINEAKNITNEESYRCLTEALKLPPNHSATHEPYRLYLVKPFGKDPQTYVPKQGGQPQEVIRSFIESNDKEIIINIKTEGGDTNFNWKDKQFRIEKRKDKIAIVPNPLVHSITTNSGGGSPYEDLKKILQTGFFSEVRQNYLGKQDTYLNAVTKLSQAHRGSVYGADSKEEDITLGDIYHLELYPEKATVYNSDNNATYNLHKSSPSQILCVNIEIASSWFSRRIAKKKMKFYREQITGKYHIPVKFFKKQPVQKPWTDTPKNLVSRITSVIMITGIVAGLFFLSSNLTGNAIADMNQTSSNWIGAISFLIGLIGAFAYIRRR